jgi:hypothetical protein
MENASKALIMAAGVLIGILILSLAVYLFASFGSTSAELHRQNDENTVNQFNSQFTSYVGKENITIYDVVTVANLATENNVYYEFTKRTTTIDGKDNYIKVTLNKTGNSPKDIEGGTNKKVEYNEYIKNDIQSDGSLTKYTCQVEISKTTQRVYLVTFEEKKE